LPPDPQPGGVLKAAPSAQPLRLPGPAALWLLATGWFALNAVSQRLFSLTAETDQAAELVRSQLWQWGYGSQPPLYTWLAKLLLDLTGPALWPLLALKVAILSALVASLLQIGRVLRFSPAQHCITVAGIVLIPQFAWESQRDLTHSVLATLLASLTLLQLLRLQTRATAGNYALAGVLSAGGMLSKYTFGVFLLGALLAGVSLPAFRRRLLTARILIALAIFAGLLAPHLLWALGQPDLALGGLDKLQAEEAFPIAQLRGLGSAAWTAIAFLTPLWIVGLVLVVKRLQPPGNPGQRLLCRLPLAIAAVLTVVILVSGATRIKDRWYQNLLFYAPALLAVLSGPAPPPRRLRIHLQTAALAAAAVSVALPARIPLAGALGRTSALNAPVVELLGRIRAHQETPILVIASDSFVGGNARRVFPDVPVLPVGATAMVQSQLRARDGLVLLLASAETKEGRGVAGLLEGLASAGLQGPHPGDFTAVSAPARWAPQERFTLFVQTLPASALLAKRSPGTQPSAADPAR
jgi:4-amino-4-deoxy-L-arabinose transferase-like glycosyltransferase